MPEASASSGRQNHALVGLRSEQPGKVLGSYCCNQSQPERSRTVPPLSDIMCITHIHICDLVSVIIVVLLVFCDFSSSYVIIIIIIIVIITLLLLSCY